MPENAWERRRIDLDDVIKAIVFDFDGVLADSEPLHLRAYQTVLAPLGVQLARDEYYRDYLGYDDEGVFVRLASAHGLDLNRASIRDLIARKTRVFDGLIASGDILYPGAVACIETMAAAYPLGIASGALRHEIEGTLRSARLDRYFQFIVASGETAAGKPAPDPYRRAAELHQAHPHECAAIEDSRWGIESAKAAGFSCVGITTTYPRESLAGADRVIESLTEFTPALIQSLSPKPR